MAVTTKIIVQQILNIDDTKATASKFPRYTVTLEKLLLVSFLDIQ
ncbi:putative tail fiber protein [Salmonella phage vB_SalS_SA001]|uniref:Putative tail fiber protein n=1 Tax=Salmonella phage vB_SalS_SA001 TaxID=2739751 RepID=A0A7D3QIJ3_9CAUD|nr:putative tail fiber protein [Salmonella phage vB_SalS_SA001]